MIESAGAVQIKNFKLADSKICNIEWTKVDKEIQKASTDA